jgi:hypothetical protein
MLTRVAGLSVLPAAQFPCLLPELRNERERSTKGKAKERESSEAAQQLKPEKGIRRRRKTLFEFGGLSFDMHICS